MKAGSHFTVKNNYHINFPCSCRNLHTKTNIIVWAITKQTNCFRKKGIIRCYETILHFNMILASIKIGSTVFSAKILVQGKSNAKQSLLKSEKLSLG